jgi:hypothetical protein
MDVNPVTSVDQRKNQSSLIDFSHSNRHHRQRERFFRSSRTALIVARRYRSKEVRLKPLSVPRRALDGEETYIYGCRQVIVVNAKETFPVDVIDSTGRRSSLPFQRGTASLTIKASSSDRRRGYEQLTLSARHCRQRDRYHCRQQGPFQIDVTDGT